MLSLIMSIKSQPNMSIKISKIFAIPLIFSSFLFNINNDQFIKQIIARWQKGQKIFAFLYWI